MSYCSIIYFKHTITIEEVRNHAQSYCEERLGFYNAINIQDNSVFFKQNIRSCDLSLTDSLFICEFRVPTPNTLEHTFNDGGNIAFRKGLLDYIGWKLGAAYSMDGLSALKQPVNTFLTTPYISFNGIPSVADNPIERVIHYLLQQNHAFYKEIYDIAPMNKKCQISYHYDDYPKYAREVQQNKRVDKLQHEIVNTIKRAPYRIDYLYGDVMRCAIVHSNLRIVELLLMNNFLLVDHIDLSLVPHPSYISKKYLKEISLPILCLTIQSLSSESFGPNYGEVIKQMIKRGANPYSRDYLGRDSLDYLLHTSQLQKKHKRVIFKEIAKYFTLTDVQYRINKSQLTDRQKEFYLSASNFLDLETADYPIPPRYFNPQTDKNVIKLENNDNPEDSQMSLL